jgi:hypothetical protein
MLLCPRAAERKKKEKKKWKEKEKVFLSDFSFSIS